MNVNNIQPLFKGSYTIKGAAFNQVNIVVIYIHVSSYGNFYLQRSQI